MILGERDLWDYVRSGRLVVRPFSEELVRGSGLDLRLGYEAVMLRPDWDEVDTRRGGDPSGHYLRLRVDEEKGLLVQPSARYLVSTLEHVELPRDLMAFVSLRSSLARLGLVIPPIVLGPGFKGKLTIGLLGGPFPVRIYPGQRIVHLVLAKLTSPVGRP